MKAVYAPSKFMFLKEQAMQAKGQTRGAIFLSRRPMRATVALGLLLFIVLAQPGLPQTTPPLKFGENFFVTGDYVVGGVGLRGLGDSTGFATGTINIPDANSVPATGVPAGADVVAAYLYWQTVESDQTISAGENGFFRGYPIEGVPLGNPNAPTSWSSGGCSGSSQGSKTMQVYRADVLSLLPVDSFGNVQPNNSYQVRLADSGSGGGGAPLTLGATLVILYRVVSPDFPLKSVVIYDGAFAPANGSTTMTQTMQGFYQAAASPIAKLTHIVGNGQDNKFQTVSLNGVPLLSPYGSLPSFPGYYNGSWDNPTWIVNNYGPAVSEDASWVAASVVPAASNSGCVSWGTIIFSTTVKDTETGGGDGLLDVWEQNHGYCDAAVNEGVCTTASPSWVALPESDATKKDVFVQMDYTCSVNPDGTCDPANSFLPPSTAQTMVIDAFAGPGPVPRIKLHLFPTNMIPEETCDDLSISPLLCSFPNQPGVVTWKGGFAFLKNQPLDPTDSSCQDPTSPTCARRFQHGKKDSYHYVIAARALGVADWGLIDGSLVSQPSCPLAQACVVVSGNTVTFATSTPHGLVVSNTAGNGRVTVADAITNPDLNGTFYVQSVPLTPCRDVNGVCEPTTFTIQIANAANATYTVSSDPDLGVASGQGGTGSGISELGGGDSLITLGLWNLQDLPADQVVRVQAGTFAHELGHSIALTHGGYFFDPQPPGSYVATIEPNCKPNFRSVMNYLFQVDLLDDGVLDYSRENLNPLDENSLPTGLTPPPFPYSFPNPAMTKWYTPDFPGAGTAATRYCDGTPFPLTTMYRVEGLANSITWSSPQAIPQDINFNGTTDTNLRGYSDWPNVDLRQVGATSSLSTVGAGSLSKGSLSKGSLSKGSLSKGSLSKGSLSKGSLSKGSLSKGTSSGNGELTRHAANSVTRPPKNLTASLTPPPRSIQLNWTAPNFGQIGAYKIYKGVDGSTPALYATVSGNPPPTSYPDPNVTCGPTYTYFVTAVLFGTNQESVPSNSVSLTACVPPYQFTGFYSPMATADPPNTGSYSGTFNKSKSITAKWTLKDSSGNLVTNVNVHTVRAIGPFLPNPDGTCRTTQTLPSTSTLLYSPTGGQKGNTTLRFSSTQFVLNWDTKVTPPSPTHGPCYVLEVGLDSGQVEKTGVKLQ